MVNAKKIEITVILVVIGWLATAGIRAVQVESKVDSHESSLKILSDKVDKISNDVSFVRGILENKKE